jgi:FG-GAP repeat protein/VCBS repeat protein
MRVKHRFAVAGFATALAAAALVAAPIVPASAAALGISSDFNGDGYRDQVIGAPNATVGGDKATGYVAIVYGSSGGLSTGNRQIIHQDSPGVPGGTEAGDQFGYSSAAGDYNGDGYADLVVGAPGENLGSFTDAGMVTLILGGPSGLQTSSVLLEGDWDDAKFGGSLAAGDFNKDGLADFALAGGNGLTWTYGFQEGTAQVRQTHDVTQQAVEPAWSTVATGDINKDGYADLVWQIYESDGGDSFDYFLGSATDLKRQSIDGMASFFGGRSQTIADVNGDGYGDLITGRPYNSGVKGGGVSVRPGTSRGLNLQRYYTISQSTSGVPGASETGDGFGVAVAARDLNGDGRAEIAVGIPGENGNSGSIALLRGSSTWAVGSGATVIHQNTSGVPGNSESGDRFGREVAFNDHNGDGRFDLAIGVPGENAWDGAIVLLKGVSGGVTTTGATAFGPASVGGLGKAGWFAASLVR